ncbi:hypothetical protein [Humidesulfovibrio sp.]
MKTRRIVLALWACLAVLACQPVTALNESDVILSPFKVVDSQGVTHLAMDGSGGVLAEGEVYGRVDSAGNVFGAEGQQVARLRASGMLETMDGEALGVISPDGGMDNGSGVQVSWREDGVLCVGDEASDIVLSPRNTAAKRAASIIVLLYLGPGEWTVEEERETP